ncbi:hypothetical protein [Pseudomonas sp. BF-B-28]|jgi:hypothetical protein|uniref:hypothetical protein n=1 Tax=Pseudomonas sp. BF-B-28 TaxID=2832353 RepID=UPI001CBCEA73|nr:hypothetical protein [Pseudomonas sp. BF-B-28]
MDKLLEYCKARYDEELGFKFSLSNIFSWVFFVVCIHVYYDGESKDVVQGLALLKVKSLMDFSDGVIPSLSILQVLYSIGFVIFVIWLSRKLSEGLFYLFTLKEDFGGLILEMTLLFHEHKSNDVRRRALGLGAKVEIERNQKRIRRTRSVAELFLVIGLAVLFVLPFGWVNLLVALVGFIVFLVVIWSSFHFFVSDLLPYYVAIKYSAGELTEIRESYSASLQN